MNERLKLLRKQKGVSQKMVAEAIGVTLSAYSNYEQGLREPSNQILINLCKYYEVSADYLLGIEDYYIWQKNDHLFGRFLFVLSR